MQIHVLANLKKMQIQVITCKYMFFVQGPWGAEHPPVEPYCATGGDSTVHGIGSGLV